MTGEDPRTKQKQDDRNVVNAMQRAKSDHCEICGQLIQSEGHACLKDVPASTAALNDPRIGMVVGRHYEILCGVGEGGMSVVYKARHQLLNKIVAIKFLKPELAQDLIKLARFQQEAMSVYRLDHPNIIRVYHFEMPKHQAFLVMDYLEGKPLSEIIATHGRLPLDRCVDIFTQVCSGMQHAHESGVIHRDIKPSNIIVSSDDHGVDYVKIVDFGIAKVSDWEIVGGIQGVTQEGEVFGSPLYMSPEQCTAKHVDARSDIYSTACVLYECLTGEPPLLGATALDTMQMHVFDVADNVSTHVPDLPNAARVDAVMFKALAKHPDRRYQSMAEFQADLESLVEKKPPPTILDEAKTQIEVYQRKKDAKQSRLHPVSIGLILLCIVLFVVSAALLFQLFNSSQVKDWPKANITAQQLFDQGKLDQAKSMLDTALQIAAHDQPDKRSLREEATLESLIDLTRCQNKDAAPFIDRLKQAKTAAETQGQAATILKDLNSRFDTSSSIRQRTPDTRDEPSKRTTNRASSATGEGQPPSIASNNPGTPSGGSATTGNGAVADKGAANTANRDLDNANKDKDVASKDKDTDRLCQLANDEAIVEIQNSEFGNAETMLNASLRAAQKWAPNSVSVVRTLHNLGYLRMTQDRLTEALPYFEHSLELAQKLDDKALMAANLESLAAFNLKKGNYQQAKETAGKAMDIHRALSGAASHGAAACHALLGDVAIAQGSYTEAESELNEAIRIEQNLPERERNARDLTSYRQGLEQLYTVYKVDPVRARALLEQIIPTQEALEVKNLTDWRLLGETLTDLADLDDTTQNAQQAIPLTERALAIAERIGEPNNSLYARALIIKAKAEWSLHSPLAEKTTIAAINANMECYGKDSPQVGEVFQQLGRMYIRHKAFQQAESVLKQSIEILSKSDESTTLAKRRESLELLRQALAGQNKTAEESEISKQLQNK